MLQNNYSSYHNHTVFSDGNNTLEEMVIQAVDLGFETIGFSEHSSVFFDSEYCMPYEKYEEYKSEIGRLREKYKGQIRILAGIEQDFFSDFPAEGFDYVIGSVHFVKIEDEFVGMDWSGEHGRDVILAAADKYFNGDVYSVIETYFDTVSKVIDVTGADLIGHFDVIRKNNDAFPFFDPENERYIAAWKKAADILLQYDKPFELNVSPLISGILSVPHPAPDIQDYIKSKGGRFIYTGDCHSTARLRSFAEYLQNTKNALQ